jgi:hypothetical protein
MRFSGGLDLSEPVCEAIVAVAESAWQRAIRAGGTRRERSDVCEIADRVGEAAGSAAAWAPRAGVVGKAQLPGGRAPVRRCL